MGKDHRAVWVVAEQIDCHLQSVSLQLIGRARKLADQLGSSVAAILLGNDVELQARQLIGAGADRVYLGNAPELKIYQPELYTEIVVNLARSQQPEIMLIGSTDTGRELAPLVAGKLKTGLTAHCIDLVLNEDMILEQRIPAYGGLLSIVCPEKRPQMATVAKGVFPTPEPDDSRSGETIMLDMPTNLPGRIKTLEIIREEPQGVPLETASTIVAGGAGAGDREGWHAITELAATLNAALGSTRPAVDEGWAELETMIGQSGKMVSPEVYIGVGLSGEQQHMVGVVGARLMIAINNDEKSPVFEQVDFGIVDDCCEFVPVLIQKIREYHEKKVTC
jgi:electron transfer flavoprotein alpha subunit